MIGAYLGRTLLGRIMAEEEFGYAITGLIPLRRFLKTWASGQAANSPLIVSILTEIMSLEIVGGPIVRLNEETGGKHNEPTASAQT